MRLLLDTHTFLWLDGSPEHLSPAALAACEEPTNELYLSVVSAWEIPHSTQFSGKEYHRSSKASRREDLQVEEPVACWDCSSFDFHATLAGMLRAPLVGYEVVQMGEPAQKRLLAAFGMMEALHHA
jgi:hypothetical protein